MELRKHVDDLLSYWVTSSQMAPFVQIKDCICEFFKTNMVNYLPKKWVVLRNTSASAGKYIASGFGWSTGAQWEIISVPSDKLFHASFLSGLMLTSELYI